LLNTYFMKIGLTIKSLSIIILYPYTHEHSQLPSQHLHTLITKDFLRRHSNILKVLFMYWARAKFCLFSEQVFVRMKMFLRLDAEIFENHAHWHPPRFEPLSYVPIRTLYIKTFYNLISMQLLLYVGNYFVCLHCIVYLYSKYGVTNDNWMIVKQRTTCVYYIICMEAHFHIPGHRFPLLIDQVFCQPWVRKCYFFFFASVLT
jgi:hypothetical protein